MEGRHFLEDSEVDAAAYQGHVLFHHDLHHAPEFHIVAVEMPCFDYLLVGIYKFFFPKRITIDKNYTIRDPLLLKKNKNIDKS